MPTTVARRSPWQLLLGLVLGAASSGALAQECRVAFDIGSSGVRAGTSARSGGGTATARVDIDYLGPLAAGLGLQASEAATAAALRELPRQGGFDTSCAPMAGGFSAWRQALRQAPDVTVALMARLHAQTGVPVLVVPQVIEGGYGHLAAQLQLGARLSTSHVLDIGGGSLQVAGRHSGFGAELGQKSWHQTLCRALGRDTTEGPCALAPLSAPELASARALARDALATLRPEGGPPLGLTAVSRPVTRGVLPAVNTWAGRPPGTQPLALETLSSAIDALAPLPLAATIDRLAVAPQHAGYLLSDMLLVEGVMRSAGAPSLAVLETDLANVPGLLRDEQAYAWRLHYNCYLSRLAQLGPDAYFTSPASCNAPR